MTSSESSPSVLLLMGVAGCGKSTVGACLAERLEWEFIEGDDFHPKANSDKMRAGIPLSDADREPWLRAIQRSLAEHLAAGRSCVLACSALKQAYRAILSEAGVPLLTVFLELFPEGARQRLAERQNHFFGPQLVESQFQALEPPEGALRLDATRPVSALVDQIEHFVLGIRTKNPGF